MLRKKLSALLLCTVLAASACLPAYAQELQTGRSELPQLSLPCKAAILIEQESGTILYEKNSQQQLPIASITKVMTMLLTMQAIQEGRAHYQDKVPVSEHAYSIGGSQIWLEPGEEFTLDEMMRAVCVSSANDAATAIAEFIGGSEPAFVEMMNQKAQELGMEQTTFQNACGLDTPGHISSARDVAIMSREILTKYPEITKYTTIWTDSLRNGQTQLVNTNKLLKRYQGITGLKTGTTGGAGVCLSASATRNGLSLIGVALGSASSADRFTSATALLDYGFANFESMPAPVPQNIPSGLPVEGGCEPWAELEFQLPKNMLVKKGEKETVLSSFDLPEKLNAPLIAGQQVGEISVFSGETLLGRWPVTVKKPVEALSLPFVMHTLWKAVLTH